MADTVPDWCRRSGARYVVTRPLSWSIDTDRDAELIVPAGFTFDVSIPPALHWLLNPHDTRYLRAACLHDYALHELRWPRVAAAAPFSMALRAEDLGRAHRLAMVLAVIVWNWR